MGGGFIHARIGLITDYMRDGWFRAVDAALDEAGKCGLKMYFYDEDKWPSESSDYLHVTKILTYPDYNHMLD